MRLPFYAVVAVMLGSLCQPARGQDRVRFRDSATGKVITASGTIAEETPAGISLKGSVATTSRSIPVPDIVEVFYEVPGGIRLDYSRAGTEEVRAAAPATKDEDRSKLLASALKTYQAILPRLEQDKNKFAVRHVHFKIASLMVLQSDEDPSQLDGGIQALQQFLKDYPDGWQVSAAAHLLARLLVSKGDAPAAAKVCDDLAALSGLPRPLQQEAALWGVQALMEGKNVELAQKKLSALQASASDDNLGARVRICQAECAGLAGKLPQAPAQLEKIIDQTTDPSLKAFAYNSLGDSYRLTGKSRDALWPYLWVDIIYHQDRGQHAYALEHLAKLFDEQGDKPRAKLYRDKLKYSER